MAPQTEFELTGTWTSLADETTFLAQIAAETTAVVTEAGRTVGNRPIHRIDLGNPDGSTVLIVCAQHGSEPASREAGLQLVRDLAYSTDPDVTGYLAGHRLVVIPNVNADGLPATRNNAAGVNLNRDWFRLTQPEARAVQQVILDAQPAVILDAHETGATTADWRPYPAGMPGTHPDITAQATAWVSRATDLLAADGYTTLYYSIGYLPWSGLSTTAGGAHAIGVLSETVWHYDPLVRTQIQLAMFNDLLGWHESNTGGIDAAHANSMLDATMSTAPVPIPTREYIGTGEVTTVDVAGYELDEPIPQHLIDAHGITVDGTYVTVNQPARLIVAALCDPDSAEKVVSATRVPRSSTGPDAPLPDGVPTSALVMVDGRPRPVIGMYYQQGGRRVPVSLT